jgi:radical SAM superfamily enzyme YgiQ (UPF0313 family)
MEIEKINAWINTSRTILLCQSPSFITNKLRDDLLLEECIDFVLLGGFDSRVLVFHDTESSIGYIYSICQQLKETSFYSKYSNKITLLDAYRGIFELYFDLLPKTKIALVSLAKKDVYTFPRFALGIADIAHVLRNEFTSNIILYDVQLDNLENIIINLRQGPVNIVGISMTFGLFDVMQEFVKKILFYFPDMKIIIGGSLASITYKEILTVFPNVIISLGEGEKSMPDIIAWYMNKKELKSIADIAYKDNEGKIVVTSYANDTKQRSTENLLFFPELDLLIPILRAKGVFQLETSRGCYNACSFCPRQYKGSWRSLTREVNELDNFLDYYCMHLDANGINPRDNVIYIVDEEFIGGDAPCYRTRSEQICKLFQKRGIRFELSFRMNDVYSSKCDVVKIEDKINNLVRIRAYGLNRVLIGVESGVGSVLQRFNKNVDSMENVRGIRILTALDIPARFTYITFDPLMSFDELINTYLFQGRKDLIMKAIDRESIIAIIVSPNQSADEVWGTISMNLPFYYYISYMLVSLECLIGSVYFNDLECKDLLENKIVTSLGKKNAKYKDWRIGLISKFSQRWIDRNFSLDYTLKSFGKIYQKAKSEEIRDVRTLLKDNSYKLLGKMIFIINKDVQIISNQPQPEIDYVKGLIGKNDFTYNEITLTNVLLNLIEYQIKILERDIEYITDKIRNILNEEDFNIYIAQLKKWKYNYAWDLLNDN